jgi:hypothetical protein
LAFPITGLSYEQVIDFCKWRTDVNGHNRITYRLPTEKEWSDIALKGLSELEKKNGCQDSINSKGCFLFNYKHKPCDWDIKNNITGPKQFDTDTLKDGGYISVSYDHGRTWMNIIKDNIYFGISPAHSYNGFNLYNNKNVLYNGEYGFSGNSNGWVTTWFAWYLPPVKSALIFTDTMIIRFNFISDSIQTNKEGWMIDNIRLYVERMSEINTIVNMNFNIYPNPFNKSTTIELDQTYKEILIELYDMEGKLIDQKTFNNIKILNYNKGKLNSGLYFIKIVTDKKVFGSKLIEIN